MIEFEFRYRPVGCAQSSVKYFLANSVKEAKKMFRYACTRKRVRTESCKIKKFNRWAKKWEKA